MPPYFTFRNINTHHIPHKFQKTLTWAQRSFRNHETAIDLAQDMLPKGLTLRGLEVFESLAATGSVAKAAAVTGLSQPAVSQQLRNLETALDVDLIDHGKRPMRLTSAGVNFLSHAEAALAHLRTGQSDLNVMDLAHLSSLSLGIIDDFENDLIPRLATILADSLKNCQFKLVTAPSHEILGAITDKSLHMAVSASPGAVLDGVHEYPMAVDPFILVVPAGQSVKKAPPADLPFLRYENAQLIGRLIDAHLTRHQLEFDQRFEVGSHQALMAMVAEGIGWAITTPMGYMRAGRFHDRIDAHPLPFAPFARRISLFASADWAGDVPVNLATTMRSLIQRHMIEPAITQLPWLSGELRVIED